MGAGGLSLLIVNSTLISCSQFIMTMNDTDRKAQKKRSRNISELTEEQIQQKRNIDRKAQRAFRQRTRDRIAHLEHDLNQLEEASGQRESQLQSEIETLREDNRVLLRRLERIAYLATSPAHVDEVDLPRPHESYDGHMNIPLSDHLQSPAQWHTSAVNAAHTTVSAGSVHESQHSPQDNSSHEVQPGSVNTVSSIPISQPEIEHRPIPTYEINQHESPHTLPTAPAIVEDTQMLPVGTPHFHGTHENDAHSPSPSTLPQTANGTRDASVHSTTVALSVAHHSPQNDPEYHADAKAVFSVLPAHIPPTCPLDQILLGFFKSQRELLANGASLESVIGSSRPSAKALVHTELSPSVHPVSKVMSEVMMTYPYVGKPEQLALFYLMHQTMRWQISPTKENYQFMPAWLKPTVTQITIPHAAWIDNVPWPGVRDLLVEYPEKYTYAHWTDNFTQNVSVNWEFDTSDAILERDNEIILHSIFEKHVRKLKSWTVSTEFANLFPDLMPAIYSRD